MIKKYFGLIVIAFLISGCSGFFLGDENLDEAVDLPSNPELINININWNQSVGDGTDEKEIKLRPAVLDGVVYAVSADEELVAYDLESGDKRWELDTGNPIAAGVVVDSGIVIVASDNGLLMAYRSEDGEFLWSYQLSSEVLARPFAIQGIVTARTIDGQVVGIDTENGQLIWKNIMTVSDLSIRGNADPVFLQGLVLFTTSQGKLNVYDIQDGKKAFTAPIAIGRGQTEVERIVDLLATPAVSNGILYVSSYRNETLAINLRDSSLLWRSELSSSKDLYVDQNYLYLIDKNSIITAVNKKTGKVSWVSNVLKGRRISPLSGYGDDLVTIDQEGILSVLSATDGRMKSYRSVGDAKAYVAPTYSNGQWVSYTSDGELTVFTLESK